MTTLAEAQNSFLETSSHYAATCWDELLDLQVGLFFPHELQFLQAWNPWKQARSILDVGCGNGSYLSRLRAFFPEKFYVGIDVSQELIEVARRRHGELTFLAKDFFSFRPKASSDLIIMRFIIQHLRDFPAILGHATNLLNPKGGILIIEPDFQNSRNVPETPQFKALLRAFDNHAASEGRNRTRLHDLRALIAGAPEWAISEHVRLAIPHVGPFWNTDVLRMYYRWIDLIQRSEQIQFPYHRVRKELASWSKSSSTFSQIGLHVFHVRRRELDDATPGFGIGQWP